MPPIQVVVCVSSGCRSLEDTVVNLVRKHPDGGTGPTAARPLEPAPGI